MSKFSCSPSISSLFRVGQIRLAELSVFNWGSFHGLHTAGIDAFGTLITGDNGSGKSTLIDGLMALLLPAGRATFNMAAAQGDRSDRTLLSYMRGSYGSAHDGASTRVKSKREGAVVTGLRALYRGDDGSCITLAAIFWTRQSTNALSDVKRIYVVGKRNLTLKEMLDAFDDGNARALKQWLREDPALTSCDESFSDYQELYRKLLYMENKNAPSLLSRALGLKKIDDLTGLIRELVLEPSTVKEDARNVVNEFVDLVAIHNKLVDTREQTEHLARLPELRDAIDQAESALVDLVGERDGLPAYFGEIRARMWAEKIAAYQAGLKKLSLLITRALESEAEFGALVERRHEDYIRAGGGRVEVLKKELSTTQSQLSRVTTQSSRYQVDVRALGLDAGLSQDIFLENLSQVANKLDRIKDDNRDSQDSFGEISGQLGKLQSDKTTIENEIHEIEARPDSNIDFRFQKLRDELVESLSLERELCVFIGELIDVKEQQQPWQGAIERALGGHPTTLAVPSSHFSMVTRWLNSRHTGLHVRVRVVPNSDIAIAGERSSQQRAEFKTDGFLSKLVWRDHPYKAWLKRHLAGFDLHCVSSTEVLDQTPYSMTREGLIHHAKGYFEKKDRHRIDDRRRWSLGFSNKFRLTILRKDNSDLDSRLSETLRLVQRARESLDAISARESLWRKLKEYQWDDINAPYWQNKTSQLQQDIQALEQADSDMDEARLRWEAAKQELAHVRLEIEKQRIQEGTLNEKLNDAEKQKGCASAAAANGLSDSARDSLKRRIQSLQENDIDSIATLELKYRQTINGQITTVQNGKTRAENGAIGTMSSFRQRWETIALDWRCDIASLGEYLEHLQQLEEEGLPQLVEQFIQRLNTHATQSLARIQQQLESERDEIVDRIGTINEVLARTEFRAGTHLKLGTKKEKYPHVQVFEQHIRKVLNQATTSDDHEARFAQIQLVVDILEKASNPVTANTLESLKLLDPRYQMSFFAEELNTTTQEVLDVLESSSGKSGGEKEAFAGTIVAASLAYVLTPDGYDRPVYCTVFLDEAFSNTAEAVSRRVLRVFRELHIHVNLITPYKNLNLARESARSLLITERDQDKHESHLCEVTWEDIDRRLSDQRNTGLQQEAEALGIEFDQSIRQNIE